MIFDHYEKLYMYDNPRTYIFYMKHVKLEISRCYVLEVESHP